MHMEMGWISSDGFGTKHKKAMVAFLMAQIWGHHEHKKGHILHRKKKKGYKY